MKWVIYTLAGAVGGLITTADWFVNVRDEKINIFKMLRNLSLGALFGGFFGTTTDNIGVAFFAGTAGELYVQIIRRLIKWV